MQRPRITPIIELRGQIQSIEARRNIADNPEYQPHRRPRLPDYHCDVFACESKRNHPDPINHPVHHEGCRAICIRVMRHFVPGRSRVVERDLESQRDEGVEERHGEVGGHGGEPAVDDELVEVEWRMAGGDDELHVGGHIECEGEERYDNQVDQTNGDGGQCHRWVEGPEIEDGEPYRR